MKRLRIAIQKSGRMHDGSLDLLKQCGVQVNNGKDQLKVVALGFPLEILYLRNSDIPQYIEDGVVDAGIIGENLQIEQQKQIDVIKALNFSKCRLSMAIAKEESYTDLSFFEGKKIATSYPNSLKLFLDKHKLRADIHEIKGSVEIAPSIGLADAVCDLVSSGNTLFKNGLREVDVLFYSQAVLVANRQLDTEIRQLLNQLIFRIQAVLLAKNNKYILFNIPNKSIDSVSNILPNIKSPTILPLVKKGWSSVHAVIPKDDFWIIVEQLKQHKAEGVLLMPIEKMVL